MEEPIYDVEDGHFDDFEEEQVNGDTGTFLMLRRNFLAPKTSEVWKHTSLLSSTCMVKGKLCYFVVDSGCSANVVSNKAVHKLALASEAHPHLYHLLFHNALNCLSRLDPFTKILYIVMSLQWTSLTSY